MQTDNNSSSKFTCFAKERDWLAEFNYKKKFFLNNDFSSFFPSPSGLMGFFGIQLRVRDSLASFLLPGVEPFLRCSKVWVPGDSFPRISSSVATQPPAPLIYPHCFESYILSNKTRVINSSDILKAKFQLRFYILQVH